MLCQSNHSRTIAHVEQPRGVILFGAAAHQAAPSQQQYLPTVLKAVLMITSSITLIHSCKLQNLSFGDLFSDRMALLLSKCYVHGHLILHNMRPL